MTMDHGRGADAKVIPSYLWMTPLASLASVKRNRTTQCQAPTNWRKL